MSINTFEINKTESHFTWTYRYIPVRIVKNVRTVCSLFSRNSHVPTYKQIIQISIVYVISGDIHNPPWVISRCIYLCGTPGVCRLAGPARIAPEYLRGIRTPAQKPDIFPLFVSARKANGSRRFFSRPRVRFFRGQHAHRARARAYGRRGRSPVSRDLSARRLLSRRPHRRGGSRPTRRHRRRGKRDPPRGRRLGGFREVRANVSRNRIFSICTPSGRRRDCVR